MQGESETGAGMKGVSTQEAGVRGVSTSYNGIVGLTLGAASGVSGFQFSSEDGSGVFGESVVGAGVDGFSFSGIGVRGQGRDYAGMFLWQSSYHRVSFQRGWLCYRPPTRPRKQVSPALLRGVSRHAECLQWQYHN